MREELHLTLQDTEWAYDYLDHDRVTARAIVFDENQKFYFVRVHRNDGFGKATLIKTAGGGVEPGEDVETALKRELKEELGAQVRVICKIGVVSDAYNRLHRHNINHYYLCKAIAFEETNLTQAEKENFQMSTLVLSWEQAVAEYQNRADTKIGRLVANRELPVLYRAEEILRELGTASIQA